MGQPLPLRPDYDGPALRAAARLCRDAAQARRLLALVAIFDGASRTEAARIGTVTAQIATGHMGSNQWDLVSGG